MIGQLIDFMEIKSNVRKEKSNGGKGLYWPSLWKRTRNRVACIMRNNFVNGQIMRMASVLKQTIYRFKNK